MSDSSNTTDNNSMSQGAKYYTLAILTIVYIFNFVDRQILVILQVPIRKELDLNYTQLGMLSGIAFAALYTTLGIPIARLADRSNRRNIIAIALTVWSGMTVACGYAQNFLQLLLARMGVGVGEAGGSPPAHSMISDMFTAEKRATALAVYSAGLYVGVMLGYFLGGYLGATFGWRQTFLIVGLPGILVALLLWTTVKEPKRQVAQKTQNPPGFKVTLAHVWRLKSFPLLAFGCAMSAFISYGTGNLMPLYLQPYHGMTLQQAGFWLALTAGAGGVIGTFLGGYLTDKIGKTDPRWYLWLPGMTAVTAIPLAIFVFNSDNTPVMLGVYFIVAVLSTMYLGPAIAVSHRLVHPQMRAMVSAILFFVLNLIGLGLGPFVLGAIADILGHFKGVDALREALTIGGCIAIIKGYLFWRAGKQLPEDLETVKNLGKEIKG